MSLSRPTKTNGTDTIYTYTGVYAAMAFDIDGNSFTEGYYYSSPACNLHVDNDTKTLVFNWEGVTNEDWQADINAWNQAITQQVEGYLRLTVPEGLFTVTAKDGQKYVNAAFDIEYEITGGYEVAKIKKVSPATLYPINSLGEVTITFDIANLTEKPAALAKDFMSSDVSLSYQANAEAKPAKKYDLKNFNYDAENGALTITFKSGGEPVTYTEPGIYTLAAPSRGVSFANEKGKTIAIVPAFSYSWTIEKPMAHYTRLEPGQGLLDLKIYDQGIASLLFAFREGVGAPNAEEDLFAQLYRDGKLISQVPTSNSRQIRYDGIYADIWSLAFWENPQGRATLPGEYTAIIPEGFFIVDGLRSPELKMNYTIKNHDWVVNPEPGTVDSFQKVTFSWPLATSVALDKSDPEKTPFLYNFDAIDTGTVDYDVTVSGNSITFETKEPVNSKGRWEVGFPEGIVSLYYGDPQFSTPQVIKEDVSATYIIERDAAVRPQIQMEKTVASLPGTIRFKLDDSVQLSVVSTAAPCYVYPVNKDGSFGDYAARYQAKKIDDQFFAIENLSGSATSLYLASGDYVIELGNKLFNTKQDINFSDRILYYFSVNAENVPYTVNPYNGQNLREFTVAEFTFDSEVTIANTQPGWITDGCTTFTVYPNYKDDSKKSIVYKTIHPVTVPGTYTLNTPAGAIKNTNPNKYRVTPVYDLRTQFTVVGEGEQLYIPAPAIESNNHPSHAADIVLTYQENGQVNNAITPALYRVNGEERELVYNYDSAKAEGNKVTLSTMADLALADGKYDLVIPEGFFFTDEAISAPAEFRLIVGTGSVEGITLENENVTVYTLDGILLMKDAPAEKLSTLPAGLYIINGRKYIIRK